MLKHNAAHGHMWTHGCSGLRMLRAALLVLYGRRTLPRGFSPPMLLLEAAVMEPQIEDEFTITLVFFFISNGRKCLLTKKGPITFAAKTAVYSAPVLQ